MNRHSRIFVAGGDTLIGVALLELLAERGFDNVVGISPSPRWGEGGWRAERVNRVRGLSCCDAPHPFHLATRDEPPSPQRGEGLEPDLSDSRAVEEFFEQSQPEFVFLVGGKSGGIGLNRERPADLMLDNLQIATNVVDAAHRFGVEKLLYLASSCAYPKLAQQPMSVESLLNGPVEPTSEAYATAKIAGWKLCEAYRRQFGCRFITGFPANAFGPHDDFDPESGHVIPALIRRMHEAEQSGARVLNVWGSGSPRREFIYSRDLADACLFVMKYYEGEAPINLGGGSDLSIAEVARTIAEIVGFRGQLVFDSSKPDGASLKALDSSVLLGMGWQPSTAFREAIKEMYSWFSASPPLAVSRIPLEGFHARAAV